MPPQSQSSGGLFVRARLLDHRADDAIDEIEQALALLGEARAGSCSIELVVDLDGAFASRLLDVELHAPALVDLALRGASSSTSLTSSTLRERLRVAVRRRRWRPSLSRG